MESYGEVNNCCSVTSQIGKQVHFSSESSIIIFCKERDELVNWAENALVKTHRIIVDLRWIEDYVKRREVDLNLPMSHRFIRAELLFHLLSLNITGNAKLAIDSGLTEHIWSAQLRRLGYQIISTNKDVDCDIIVKDINDVNLLDEGRVYLSGLRMEISGKQGVMYSRFRGSNILSGFGRTIRGNSMKLAQCEKEIYLGLGDRAESVEWGLQLHVKCVHYGLVGLLPRRFERLNPVVEGVTSTYAPKVPAISSQGQRKLEVMHNWVLMKDRPLNIVYAGGAPGTSLYNYLRTYKPNCVIIDPAEIDPSLKGLNVKHLKSVVDMAYTIPTGTLGSIFINDIRGSRPKKGMLVLAPSGSGKSYYAKKGYWKDGDTLVKWPREHHWWETMPLAKQKKMGLEHLSILEEKAKKDGIIIAFNPSWEVLSDYIPKVPVIVWMISEGEHRENLARRVAEGNTLQPVDIDTMVRGRKILSDFASRRGITVVDNVDDAIFDIEWEAQIMNDYNLSLTLIQECKVKLYHVYYGKFRIPKFWDKFRIPKGSDIYFQPWAGSNSTEGRLYINLTTWDGSWEEYPTRWYVEQIRHYNFERYNNLNVNYDQERRLLDMAVIRWDFVAEEIKVKGGLRFALWSSSNTINGDNPRDVINKADFTFYPNANVAKQWPAGYLNIWYFRDYYEFDILFSMFDKHVCISRVGQQWVTHHKKKDTLYIVVPPNIGIIRFFDIKLSCTGEMVPCTNDYGISKKLYPISDKQGNKYVREFIVQQNGKDLYRDYVLDVNTCIEGYRWMNSRDYVVFCQYDQNGILRNKLCTEGFDFTHPIAQLWGMWFNVRKSKIETRLQTWLNSQTSWTKVMSSGIRRITGLSEDDMHEWRRGVLAALYSDINELKSQYTVRILKDRKITGVVTNKLTGRRHIVSVAGHMIGMLLSTNIGVTDIQRYCDTLNGNLSVYGCGNACEGNLRSMSHTFASSGRLGETNYKKGQHLWHSWFDYWTGLATYLYICKRLRLGVNVRAVLIVVKNLRVMRKIKGSLDEGWQARSSDYKSLKSIK
jgi:hypothetical protein